MTFDVAGPIDARWAEWNRDRGAFGPPVGPEEGVTGRNARRQAFQRGEIAWSADVDIVVSVFRLRNDALFEWSHPGGDHDHFRYDIAFRAAGQDQWQPQGLDVAELRVEGQQQMWVRLQGFGDYAFTIRSCDGDDCAPFTVPVTVHLGLHDESPDPGKHPDVHPELLERWHELGAWDGPLGLPTRPAGEHHGDVDQGFEHGWITTARQFGPGTVVAACQRHTSVEVTWGGTDIKYNAFRVDAYRRSTFLQSQFNFQTGVSEWARSTIGSGSVLLDGLLAPGDGNNQVWLFMFPAVAGLLDNPASPGLFPDVSGPTAEAGPVGATPSPRLDLVDPPENTELPYPPLDALPAQAFASQRPRADAIARHYAARRPLGLRLPQPDNNDPHVTEGVALQLIAHLHAVSKNPEYRTPGELPSRLLVPIRLRTRRAGKVGTKNDYDMALKGLVVLLHRYSSLLAQSDIDFIVQDLFPQAQTGPLDPDDFRYLFIPPNIEIPETENHLLMIESSKYLVNQLLFAQTGDTKYDNTLNNVLLFLMDFLQTIARFDFMEFNARPYQRLSLHALMNLFEFAKDESLRTAAAVVLDYTCMKFAVGCSRERRISPFRRLQERVYHPAGINELTDAASDQVGGFFHAWLGPVDSSSTPTRTYWEPWGDTAVIAALSSYRPPAAAYAAARQPHPPAQHVICHGQRGQFLEFAADEADGGVEIYFQSPSFVLNAGGSFLNSGYGHDEIDLFVDAWAQTARAQAIGLIPARLDLRFSDLIRIDAWPDGAKPDADSPIRARGVNMGMHRNFACGADVQVPQMWLDISGATWEGPWLVLDLNQDPPGPRLGFYVAVYRTAPDPEAAFDPVPSSIGMFHAMEADLTHFGGTAMSFADFKRLTLERNTHLPPLLAYGSTQIFHTADDQHLTFWLDQLSERYRPRVVADGEPAASFHARPLCSGPYLASPHPDGHDGYIEIRHPDNDIPLVLDFRDRLKPVRTDTEQAFPQPHLDRAHAIIEYSLDLIRLARAPFDPAHPIDPLDALRTAVDVYRGYEPVPPARAKYFTLYGQAARVLAVFLTGTPLLDEEITSIREGVAALREASGSMDADPIAIAAELTGLAGMLATCDLTGEAVRAQITVVSIARDLPVPPGREAARQLVEAEALQNLIARLLEDDPGATVTDLAAKAILAYQAYPGAEHTQVANDLTDLSKQLTALHLDTLAVQASRAAVDALLAGHPSDPAGVILLAEARHNLLARLLTISATSDADALVPDILDGYRVYAASSTVDHISRVLSDLHDLANQLQNADLTDALHKVQQVLDELA